MNNADDKQSGESGFQGRRERRGTLGRLRDALTKPLPDDMRRQHFRVYQIAEMLLKHEDLTFHEIIERVEKQSTGFEIQDPDLTQKH